MKRILLAFISALFLMCLESRAYAQVCPPCSCNLWSDQRVQQACSVVERIANPLRIGKKKSACSVVQQVADPVCQQCNNLHDQCLKITPSIPSLSEVCRASVDLARSAQQKANGARTQFWTQLSSAVRKSGINVEQDVVLYDLGGKASFNYNAYAGLAWYEVTLPKGVKVEEGKVKSSLNGEYSIPNVDPMTVFNELGFIKTSLTNKYDSWAVRKSARKDRKVYVSSKRFVDTVSLENASQEVFWAVVTAGQTAQGSVAALKEQIVLEWGDILSWLRDVGAEKQEEVAAELAKAILQNGLKAALIPIKISGQKLDFDIDVELVDYEYEVRPSVSGEMKKLLSLIGVNSDKALGGLGSKVRIPHVAFSIAIKGLSSDPSSYSKRFTEFAENLQKGPAIDIGNLADKISGAVGIDLSRVRHFKDAQGQGSIRESFTKAFAGVLNDFEKYHKGGGIFDFTDSPFAHDLRKKLDGLMIGNAKAAYVRKLIVDVESATIGLEVDLKSKHRLLRVDVLRELDKAWNAKDEAESKVFNAAFGAAKSGCDKLAQICRSLPGGTAPQVCNSTSDYQSLALEPLSKPVDQAVTHSDSQRLVRQRASNNNFIGRADFSVADPALPMTNTVINPVKGSKSVPSISGACHGIFVGRRYILTQGCDPKDDDTDFMNIDGHGLTRPLRNPVSKIPVESRYGFNLSRLPLTIATRGAWQHQQMPYR